MISEHRTLSKTLADLLECESVEELLAKTSAIVAALDEALRLMVDDLGDTRDGLLP